jgi:NAD(P)-dependent dehydrogenase (short-subunit alcohol dehydrogenase family)
MDVSGKKAIVFGGTSGIGLAAAQQLAAKGALVTVISRNPDRAGNLPKGVTAAKCDVRDRAAMSALFESLAPFDILVSSATGGDRALGPFLAMDLDGYQASFDKLWGYANVVRLGAKHLTDKGTIVLVSGSPARKCKPGQVALSSVGAAVEALVRAVAPGAGRAAQGALREDHRRPRDSQGGHGRRGGQGHPVRDRKRFRHRHDRRRGWRLAGVVSDCGGAPGDGLSPA